jgi:hypothetical protein
MDTDRLAMIKAAHFRRKKAIAEFLENCRRKPRKAGTCRNDKNPPSGSLKVPRPKGDRN